MELKEIPKGYSYQGFDLYKIAKDLERSKLIVHSGLVVTPHYELPIFVRPYDYATLEILFNELNLPCTSTQFVETCELLPPISIESLNFIDSGDPHFWHSTQVKFSTDYSTYSEFIETRKKFVNAQNSRSRNKFKQDLRLGKDFTYTLHPMTELFYTDYREFLISRSEYADAYYLDCYYTTGFYKIFCIFDSFNFIGALTFYEDQNGYNIRSFFNPNCLCSMILNRFIQWVIEDTEVKTINIGQMDIGSIDRMRYKLMYEPQEGYPTTNSFMKLGAIDCPNPPYLLKDTWVF